jgi:O-antigen/teichoic acid export membrane protein
MDGLARTDHRRLLTSAVANWFGFAAQIAAAFYLCPVLIQGLGDRRYGIWSLVESILAYLTLFDLGVAVSVVRYVARFEARQDWEGLNRVFSTCICIFTAAGLAVLALTLLLALPGISLLPLPTDLAQEGRWMLVLLGLNLATGLPLNVFACILDGLGRYPARSGVCTVSLVIRSILILLTIRAQGGLIALAVVITSCTVLENLALAVTAWSYLPGLRFSLGLVDRATFKTIRGYSVHALLAMLAGRISFQTDALVIGAFLPQEQITFFMIGARLVEYAKGTLRVATTVLTPAVSALEAQGRQTAIREVLVDHTRYVLWLLLPLQLGLLLLGFPFLTLWVGPEHACLSHTTLIILSVPLALALSQSVSARILYGIGELRWFARAAMTEAAVNLVLSVVLVRWYGIEGVALGTAIPNMLVNCAIAAHVCRILGIGLGRYVRLSFPKPCAVAVLLGLGWWSASRWHALTSWESLSATILAGLAGYFLLASLVEWGPRQLAANVRVLCTRLWRRIRPSGMPQDPLRPTRQPEWSAADLSQRTVPSLASRRVAPSGAP